MTHWQKVAIGTIITITYLPIVHLAYGPLSIWQVVASAIFIAILARMALEQPRKANTVSVTDAQGVMNTVRVDDIVSVGLDVDPPDSETFVVNVTFHGINQPVKFYFNQETMARQYIDRIAKAMEGQGLP